VKVKSPKLNGLRVFGELPPNNRHFCQHAGSEIGAKNATDCGALVGLLDLPEFVGQMCHVTAALLSH